MWGLQSTDPHTPPEQGMWLSQGVCSVTYLDTWRIPEELLYVKSQNAVLWEGSLEVTQPNLLPKTWSNLKLDQVAQGVVQTRSEYLQGCLHRYVSGHVFQHVTTLTGNFYFSWCLSNCCNLNLHLLVLLLASLGRIRLPFLYLLQVGSWREQ